MLEFDGQSLDPAIVSAQPMKSAQMVCAPGKDGNLHHHLKTQLYNRRSFQSLSLDLNQYKGFLLSSNNIPTLRNDRAPLRLAMWQPFLLPPFSPCLCVCVWKRLGLF